MKCFKGQKTFVFFFEHLIVNFHNKILSMDFQDNKKKSSQIYNNPTKTEGEWEHVLTSNLFAGDFKTGRCEHMGE